MVGSIRVAAALKSSSVLVAIKSMWSKIWTGAQNSKEGNVSWTAWQQLQAGPSVLFQLGIVRIRHLVFKVQTTGRGSTGRGWGWGRERTAAPCKILVHFSGLWFNAQSYAPLRGKYDSALMKCSIHSAFGPHIVGLYCLIRLDHVSTGCNFK